MIEVIKPLLMNYFSSIHSIETKYPDYNVVIQTCRGQLLGLVLEKITVGWQVALVVGVHLGNGKYKVLRLAKTRGVLEEALPIMLCKCMDEVESFIVLTPKLLTELKGAINKCRGSNLMMN